MTLAPGRLTSNVKDPNAPTREKKVQRDLAVWVSVVFLSLPVATPAELKAQGDPLDPYNPSTYRLKPGILWTDIGFSVVYDTNIEQTPTAIDGPGLLADVRAQLRTSTSRPLLRIEYWGRIRQFNSSEKWNRDTHSVLGVLEQRLGPVGLEAIGSLQFNGQTEDRETADAYMASPRISLRFGRSRVRAYGRYWTREFEQDLGRETIRMVGAELRLNVIDRIDWEVGFRREKGESDRPSGRFERHSLSAAWRTRLTQQATLVVQADRREREYPERWIEVDGIEVPTEDLRWIPSIYLKQGNSPGREVRIGYEYEVRSSNDLRREYYAHRATLSFRVPLFGWFRQPVSGEAP
jgi:hypothetical protein